MRLACQFDCSYPLEKIGKQNSLQYSVGVSGHPPTLSFIPFITLLSPLKDDLRISLTIFPLLQKEGGRFVTRYEIHISLIIEIFFVMGGNSLLRTLREYQIKRSGST